MAYMGIGFGRNEPGSGLTYGTPSHNPFLNLISINGQAPMWLRNGYMISTRGASLGLTSNNTAGAAWTQLEKMAGQSDPRAWAAPLVAFTVNDSKSPTQANALIDTSITQMYI